MRQTAALEASLWFRLQNVSALCPFTQLKFSVLRRSATRITFTLAITNAVGHPLNEQLQKCKMVAPDRTVWVALTLASLYRTLPFFLTNQPKFACNDSKCCMAGLIA